MANANNYAYGKIFYSIGIIDCCNEAYILLPLCLTMLHVAFEQWPQIIRVILLKKMRGIS